MNEPLRLERALRHILWEMRAYLPDLVVIGGWVPYLYRRYGGFPSWTLELPLTTEVDILVPQPLPRCGHETIPEILLNAGFEPRGGAGHVAVWAREPEAGEMVEFLVAHTGTARQRGQVVPVTGQEGLGAIALEGLDLLRRHTTTLTVPLRRTGEATHASGVIVPRLGIYAVNKAVTFPYRSAEAVEMGNPRRTKDLLYLRDLMAAGETVATHIEDDIREIIQGDDRARRAIRTASQNLELVLAGALQAALPEVADAVSLRTGSGFVAALSDVRGHLTDFQMILEEALHG